MTTRDVTVAVDGTEHRLAVEARTLLSDCLRHDAGATDVHVACEQGACGACTVLVDDQPVRSCLLLAVQADGAEITTASALGTPESLHPVQQALHDEHGLQCGFCTPGIVVALVAAARRGASEEEALDEVLGGHLCRCTGYVNIRAAVRTAWAALGDGATP